MKWIILVAVTVLCCLQQGADTGVIPKRRTARSAPLTNAHTHRRVKALADHAQNLDNDTDTRLMPLANHSENQTNLYICCLHANILDFYLWNILTTSEMYPHLTAVKKDLHRVSRDLKLRGCPIKHVDSHGHSKHFKEEFLKMGKKGENKAIGEIDILFDYLSTFCI